MVLQNLTALTAKLLASAEKLVGAVRADDTASDPVKHPRIMGGDKQALAKTLQGTLLGMKDGTVAVIGSHVFHGDPAAAEPQLLSGARGVGGQEAQDLVA